MRQYAVSLEEYFRYFDLPKHFRYNELGLQYATGHNQNRVAVSAFSTRADIQLFGGVPNLAQKIGRCPDSVWL